MIKTLLIWTTIAFVLLMVSIFTGIAMRIENKPTQAPAIDSVLANDAYLDSADEAEQWLADIYRQSQLPSVSVAVGVRGELVWAGALGYADIKENRAASINTRYRIGSVSKPISASVLMKMSEQNRIELNKPFTDYATGFDENFADITVRDLVSHQAGIRHYKEGLSFLKENFSNKHYATTRQAAAIIEKDPLLFSPGTDFKYSTYGYTLLSLAMEKAYGDSFENLMQQELFEPLGLSSMAFDKPEQYRPNQAAPYLLIKNRIFRAPSVNLSYKYAAGGYISTPSDLVEFGNALLTNHYLSEDLREQLWTPQVLDSGEVNRESYALGFRTGKDELGLFAQHGGKSVGGYAYFVIYPEHELVIALVTNATPTSFVFDRYQEAKKLAKLFL